MGESTFQNLFFYYRPAYFAGFAGEEATKIKIWLEHPGDIKPPYHLDRSIPVDLGKTPSNETDWQAVQVDDHCNSASELTTSSGLTTIGPLFPHAYGAAGVYLTEGCLKPRESVRCDETALIRRPSGSKRFQRYHGFIGLRPDSTKQPDLWVVYHPGWADQRTARAPRKAWIPSDLWLKQKDVDPAKEIPKLIVEEPDGLYIESDFAVYTALLSVPKRPSTSGQLLALRLDDVVESPEPQNLNVLGHEVSGEIANIRVKLEKKHALLQLQENETLVDALARYCKLQDRKSFTNLDLIGHSRPDGILKLGEFALTPKNIDEQFARLYDLHLLKDLGISSVRLLGCCTGCHPRSREVVTVIREYMPELKVYASRADLVAAHYDENGLKKESEALLADHDVVTGSGPGDVPPTKDYPSDTDEEDDSTIPSPSEFAIATLSGANAAVVGARKFLFWNDFATRFGALQDLLYATTPISDNELVRADYEVLVAIKRNPRSIDHYRSFEVILNGEPRVRVYAGDDAFAFAFKDGANVRKALKEKVEIHCDTAVGAPPWPRATPASEAAAK